MVYRKLFLLYAFAFSALGAQVSVLMNRYDPAATGANPHETILTPDNVKPVSFGKLFSYYVDGAVYAQLLYVPSVRITGKELHNVVYIATMNDKVYAFDA